MRNNSLFQSDNLPGGGYKWFVNNIDFNVFKNGSNKRKYSDADNQQHKRKPLRRKVRKSALLRRFQSTVSLYHQTQGGGAVLEDNLFRSLTGDEDENKLIEKFGQEKFQFVLQLVNYFDDLLIPPLPKSDV